WLMTDKYDPTNPEHLRIVRGIELGNGITRLVTAKECLQALATVGFKVEKVTDLAENEDKVQWYSPLQGSMQASAAFWDYVTFLRTTTTGRATTTYLLRTLETLGLVAPGSAKVSGILQTAADSLVEAAVLGIFTPMYLFVARKPE
ncbi:Delta(24)-sterol C-methyltransferase, partial [Haplosporangium bisporale]